LNGVCPFLLLIYAIDKNAGYRKRIATVVDFGVFLLLNSEHLNKCMFCFVAWCVDGLLYCERLFHPARKSDLFSGQLFAADAL